jgi:threonyl-tRNA synthetase
MTKIPYMCVIGGREAQEDTVALRVRGAGKKQESFTATAFIERVVAEIRTRALTPGFEAAPEAAAAGATA